MVFERGVLSYGSHFIVARFCEVKDDVFVEKCSSHCSKFLVTESEVLDCFDGDGGRFFCCPEYAWTGLGGMSVIAALLYDYIEQFQR